MSSQPGIRVRFAPSPTGRLHIGGARTALFNWLYARRCGGRMILRIEDTDRERSTPESERDLLADLRWMGLDWDEGPDIGGPHVPYRQSERLALYAEHAATLQSRSRAYACFCSDADLAARRAAQLAAGAEPRYDGPCRNLGAESAAARVAAGVAHTIRFRVPEMVVRFQDRVRGNMSFESTTVGDFVLVRSNGLPTYNFACVVDDAAMGITHVVRGEDHLSNTMRQVLLYRALELQQPEFAHLSLILDTDRSKLKKREGQEGTYVDEYRTRGYLPAALVNFLALLGWSPPDGVEVMSVAQLVAAFDLDRVSRSPAVFDAHKLRWMAGEHLRAASVGDLARGALPHLRAAGLDVATAQAVAWIAAFRDSIAALGELPERVALLLEPPDLDDAARSALDSPQARELLAAVHARLDAARRLGRVDGAGFKSLLGSCGKELGVKGRDLFQPVRVALSAQVHGPELPLLYEALGAERVLERLAAAAKANPAAGS